MLLVQRQVLLVDRSLVDRVRTGVVDYFAGKIGNRVFINRCSIIEYQQRGSSDLNILETWTIFINKNELKK